MVKVLLSCDDYAYLHNGRYYTKPDLMLFYQRYLRIFDMVRVVCRCKEETTLADNRIPFDSDTRLELFPVPFFQGPKGYVKVFNKVGRSIVNAIEGCDAAILRIPSTVALRVGKYAKKAGLPYACEVVFDAQDMLHNSKGINKLVWKIIDNEMRELCSSADGVSCVTENYLQQHYYSNKSNAFTSNYSSISLPKSFYSVNRTFPQNTTKVIAHIANQVQYEGRKGHVEIIYALRELKRRNVSVIVRFAGQDYFGGVRKLQTLADELGVGNMIEFVGYLSREGLDLFLNDADMYVMPTRAEGLPRVIIEAMSKGLPCITTPVSGNPELVDSHFLVPYEDSLLLADRIEELFSDKKLYEQTSFNNFERSKKYEASLLQSKRDEFYSKLKERAVEGNK